MTYINSEADLRGGEGGGEGGAQEAPTIPLFEVELIINNALLIYVYPNIIETCLTPNYLSFGRQLV